jgi:hypothetical protein
MITASVGIGTDLDARKAGAEACMQALEGLSRHQANVLFVFGSISFDQDKLMEGVAETAGGCLVIGCSTAGEISSEGYSAEKSVVVMAISSDQVKFWGGAGHHILWNPKQAGEECANALEYSSHGYITSALFFLDILSGNGDLTLAGAFGLLGKNFPLFGCAAADDLFFYETYQYLDGKAYSGSVVGVGLSGEYKIAGVVKHGFLPIGIARKVTKSEGTTLFELDGKPAVSIYEDYFGEEHLKELHKGLLPSHTISYPLGIFLPESNNVMLRNPVFVDQRGAMTFTAAIPEGAEIRLMISDLERGLETAELAAKEVLLKLEGRKPKAVIVMSSVARKIMLGVHADEEIQIIQNIIGRDVPMVGLYSYAQVGGQQGDEIPFQNGSLLIWALAE